MCALLGHLPLHSAISPPIFSFCGLPSVFCLGLFSSRTAARLESTRPRLCISVHFPGTTYLLFSTFKEASSQLTFGPVSSFSPVGAVAEVLCSMRIAPRDVGRKRAPPNINKYFPFPSHGVRSEALRHEWCDKTTAGKEYYVGSFSVFFFFNTLDGMVISILHTQLPWLFLSDGCAADCPFHHRYTIGSQCACRRGAMGCNTRWFSRTDAHTR